MTSCFEFTNSTKVNNVRRRLPKPVHWVALVTLNVLTSSVCAQHAFEDQIDSQAAQMAGHISSAGLKTIAVVDFTDLRGQVTELGRFLAEEFSAGLAGAREGFQVVDRTHLKIVLREHKLGESGVIDPATGSVPHESVTPAARSSSDAART